MSREGLEVGHLEAFIAVERFGNVTRAGESLFLTQPAVSARLKRLEQCLGQSLLIRDRRGARLTQAGIAFLPYAKQALAILSQGQQAVRSAPTLPAALVFATIPSLSISVLPGVIKCLIEDPGGLYLDIRVASSENVLDLVLADEVAFGLGSPLSHPEIESTALYVDELVMLCHPSHRLAQRKPIQEAELAGETLIAFRDVDGSDVAEHFGYTAEGLFNSVLSVSNAQVATQLVLAGVGITRFPRLAVLEDLQNGLLHEISVQGIRPVRQGISILQRRDIPLPVEAEILLGVLHEHLGSLGTVPSSGAAQADGRSEAS